MRFLPTKGVYLVADTSVEPDKERLLEIIRQAVSNGVVVVQLRAKGWETAPFLDLAKQALVITRLAGVPLIINDNVRVALKAGADGVHLGQSDMPVHQARELLGPNSIIGLSLERKSEWPQAHTPEIDYVAASPVFSTQTKLDVAEGIGIDGLMRLVQYSPIPVAAIGGISEQNIGAIAGVGATWAAVVSAICLASDPAMATRTLSAAFEAGWALGNVG
jgi:thiamine-phosphate pyrophosphorylase